MLVWKTDNAQERQSGGFFTSPLCDCCTVSHDDSPTTAKAATSLMTFAHSLSQCEGCNCCKCADHQFNVVNVLTFGATGYFVAKWFAEYSPPTSWADRHQAGNLVEEHCSE